MGSQSKPGNLGNGARRAKLTLTDTSPSYSLSDEQDVFGAGAGTIDDFDGNPGHNTPTGGVTPTDHATPTPGGTTTAQATEVDPDTTMADRTTSPSKHIGSPDHRTRTMLTYATASSAIDLYALHHHVLRIEVLEREDPG